MAVVAISAGHNKNTGARAIDKTDEWSWSMISVEACYERLISLGHTVHILYRDGSVGYTTAMKKLGKQMKELGVEACTEFHFNSSDDPNSNGYEFLHWWKSKASEKLAQCIGSVFGCKFPTIKMRGNNGGARSLWYFSYNKDKAYGSRGSAYCYHTPCPAVICEPCFASNAQDWNTLKDQAQAIGDAYALGIDLFIKTNR